MLVGGVVFAALFVAAAYPEVRPIGIQGEAAYHPKRFKGNGLNTDKFLSGESDQSKIVELTPETLDGAVREYAGVFVAWCMADTGQVDGLLIEWGRLALEQEPNRVKKRTLIAKVDAVKHAALAARYNVEHYPTLTWFQDGREVQQYPEDATRFAFDFSPWIERQFAGFGRVVAKAAAAEWAAVALRDLPVSVFGYFEAEDDPLLGAIRHAVGRELSGRVDYTPDPAAYDAVRSALAAPAAGGDARPLLLVKAFDERVVAWPRAAFAGLSGDALQLEVARWLKLHNLPRVVNFQEAYQRFILERAAYMPLLLAVGTPWELAAAPLAAVAREYERRLLVVTVDPKSAETPPLLGWLGLGDAAAAMPRYFGYAMRS
eukprot:59128-Prymnesium_polylepis.1